MIACIGMIAADLTVKPVEKLPELGFLSPVDSISIHTGGCAANSAIDLCKMGFETEIFGMIGDDFFGKFIVQEFKKANVKMRGLKISESCTTGTTIALIHPQGERRFLYSGAANDLFGYDDIEWKLIESCDIVFITGTLLLNSLVGLPCAKVLKKAKALGKITALDTVWDHTGRWMSLLESCIPYIDYFMPSLDEAIQLSGEKIWKTLQMFFSEWEPGTSL